MLKVKASRIRITLETRPQDVPLPEDFKPRRLHIRLSDRNFGGRRKSRRVRETRRADPFNERRCGKVGEAFGVYDPDAGIETRGRFIIDPDGVIQGYEVLTPPVGRNVSESLRQVQAFQLVRNSKGTEATPSGWRPGKQTLKPGPDLVGRVWEVWKTDQAFD